MSRFLMCTMSLDGHVNPGLPIARALVERGHTVWWYTGRRFQAAVEATGARYVAMQSAPDLSDVGVNHDAGDAEPPGFLAKTNWGIKRLFIDPIPGQVADLQRILRDFPADVLLNEMMFLGAEAVHALGGPPWASFGIGPLMISSRDTAPFTLALPPSASLLGRLRNRLLGAVLKQVVLRESQYHYNYVRWTLGLSSRSQHLLDTFSPYLYLQSGTAAFEYPRSDLPPQVHFIGPLQPPLSADFTPPAWWGELDGTRPVVHITQGTVATEASDLLVPALWGLADEDVLVVATTGGMPVESVWDGSLPANARVEPFLPHGHLLPHVDVMVTNGGYGGVQAALANGVSLVVAGATEEKPEVAARVAWSGAGINLKTKSPTPEQIRFAVRSVLDDPRYRQRARHIQADYVRHNAPQEAVALLERLVATGRPVLRGQRPAEDVPRHAELLTDR